MSPSGIWSISCLLCVSANATMRIPSPYVETRPGGLYQGVSLADEILAEVLKPPPSPEGALLELLKLLDDWHPWHFDELVDLVKIVEGGKPQISEEQRGRVERFIQENDCSFPVPGSVMVLRRLLRNTETCPPPL